MVPVLSLFQFSLEKANEIEEFFASHIKPSIARTLKQRIEPVHINAKWVESIRNESSLIVLVEDLTSRN